MTTVPKLSAANLRRTIYLRDQGICCLCGTEVALSETGLETTTSPPRLAHRRCLPSPPPAQRFAASGPERVNPDPRVLERAAEFTRIFATFQKMIADDENFDQLVESDRETLRTDIQRWQEGKTLAEANGDLEGAKVWTDLIRSATEFADKHPRTRLSPGFAQWVAVHRILAESHIRQMTIDIHCEESADKETHQAVIVKNEGRRCACGYKGYTVPM